MPTALPPGPRAGGVGVGAALVLAGFAAAKTMAWFAPAFAIGEFGM